MRKLGLVGGTAPESTLAYYREINYIVHEKTNGKAFPELAIDSINLYKALDFCKEQKDEELVAYLLDSINNLAKGGAEFAALTANTMHSVFDVIKQQSPIPLVSIVESVCDEAKRRGYRRVGLIGTIFTMTGQFFKVPFEKQRIDVIIPANDKIELVNNIIANELEVGIVNESSTQQLIAVINEMRSQQGIEAIILGCTELPLALNEENCLMPCLDTMKIHIEALAVEIMK